ncbi:E3 SUMO-protein ligase PIAS2-like isoform X2 [Tachypleus tridentatus]|uniref:E3 SUMO-protein ligase PIAS2-like isoform X2 n=1 Tax=Tachypleus tridentatus TaxID=6853 RepID=UPI003FD2041B
MSESELRQMVLNFRVSELQVLLGFAGRNKSGKKQELQYRSLELLKLRSTSINMKIQELHKQRFPANTSLITSTDPGHLYGVPPSHLKGPRDSIPGNQLIPGSSLHPVSTIDYSSPKHNVANIQSGYNMTKYPVHPDVCLKPLPFYDVLAELLKPSSLMPTKPGRFQEDSFTFHLTPQQAHDIAMSRGSKDYGVQVQLRFCLLETSCEQEDNFPPSICVRVNCKMCPLPNPIPTNKPGVEPKRPSRPVNITGLCRLCPTVANHISVSWTSEYGRGYSVAVYLVRRLSSSNLLSRLRSSGIKNPDHTRAMIKEKLQHDPDSEIATTSLRGSLMCPLGKMRMQIPCRVTTCVHVQCFDASLYLQMNEKKPTWICPVCDKPAIFSNLVIDGLFTEILSEAPIDCYEVQFHENGTWTPVLPKKENKVIGSSVIQKPLRHPSNKKKTNVEVIDLTLESSSDDEELSSPTSQSTHPFPFYLNTGQSPTSSISAGPPGPIVSIPSPASPSSSNSSLPSVINCPLPPVSSSGSTSSVTKHYNSSFHSVASPVDSSNSSSSSSSAVSSTGNGTASLPPVPSSLCPSVPVMDTTTPPYYPPVSSPYSDLLVPHSSHVNSYPNFSDLYTILDSSESDRQFDSLFQQMPSSSSAVVSRPRGTPPDVISLD